MEVIQERTDTLPEIIVRRGINYKFNRLAGSVVPTTGIKTGRDGIDEPLDSDAKYPRPEPGYRRDYFPDDKHIYWIQEDGNDRIYTPRTDPVTKPNGKVDTPVITIPSGADNSDQSDGELKGIYDSNENSDETYP